MINSFINAGLEQVINRLLQLDPQSLQRLRTHQGKIVALFLPAWNKKLFFIITEQGLQLLANYEGTPDTLIKGSIASLLKQITTQHTSTDIIIEGDLELGQQIRDLLRALDIDWEEQLAIISGDIVANQVGNTFRKLRNWSKQTSNKLQQDLTDYLQEETRLLPSQVEVETFLDEVSMLRDDVERLAIIIKGIAE